jgi:hypothetical protein
VTSSKKTCPSSTCHEGALLLGVLTSGGTLAYVHPSTTVDAAFVDREVLRGNPERRYRFAAPCVEGACPQWTGERCAIADMAPEAVRVTIDTAPRRLPACSIRRSCRWYFQRGVAACTVCPFIVADMGGTDTYRSSTNAKTPEQKSSDNSYG